MKISKNLKMKLFLILFFTFTSFLFAQKTNLTGKIYNLQTRRPIPFVNVGIQGTYFGTSSNEYGNFKLVLSNGSYNLIVSCVGFESTIIKVSIPNENEISINLKPIPIELPEVVIDADENPAYTIIRKAIANKKKNKLGLKNYNYDFYSKNIFKSGEEIVFIEEDVGEGFKILPNDVKELKTELSKTKNISKQTFQNSDLNFFEKEIIDFTDDSLTLGKFVFHLPISKFAFDYYDYLLLGVQQSNNHNFYQIKVIPYSKIRPTFRGEILIDDSSYALAGLNLTLENRNLMPFTDFKMSIIQNLINYKNYWLPKYYNIDIETNINYYHLIKLDSAITSFVKVFNNYKINLNKDDPLLKNINQIGDTTIHFDSKLITKTEMDSLRLYPLLLRETKAYEEIDSTKRIVSSLKLGGIGGEYIKSNIENPKAEPDTSFNILNVFKYLDFQNNRVDGIMLGLKHSDWVNKSLFNYSTNIGYSFSRKDIESNLSLFFPVKNSFVNALEFNANYSTLPIISLTQYSEFFNAISVSLGFEDQFNYYFSRGLSVGAIKNITKKTNVKFSLNIESQRSITEKKYYSIFNSNRKLRKNPKIIEGMDNCILLELNIGSSPYKFDVQTNDGFSSKIEYSSELIGSDFNYLKVSLGSQFFIRTFYDELFFSPYMAIFIEVNSVLGSFGPQHLTTPQTAMGVFSPLGTMKGILPYQFIGDKSISIHLEHNWRKTFFDMLGIYFPVAWNLELTTGISGLGIWNDSNYLNEIKSDDYYWEIYSGISGILGLLNINVAYNKLRDTVVRFGFSKFF